MENAAQALLIAGGILLAILTISLLVYMFNSVSLMETARAEQQEAEQLAEWNAEWEAYNKKLLYGVDVLTVVNKAKQNDIDYDYSEIYKVEIVVEGVGKSGEVITTENIVNHKKSIFKCTKIEYSRETGRVNKMEFELIEDLG